MIVEVASAARWLLDGMEVSGGVGGYIWVSAIFGLVNAVIKPIVKLFSLPFYVLTLGLFGFIVNALMLELVAWLSREVGLTFDIDDFFWSAILAALVVTLVAWALDVVLPDGD